MSVIAASAGEGMVEPGESEACVAILAADKEELYGGRAIGAQEAVVVEAGAKSRSAGSDRSATGVVRRSV